AVSTACYVQNRVLIVKPHNKTIRDCNAKKLIQMVKIDTEQNVADLLTKGFDAGRFQYLVSSIGMLNPNLLLVFVKFVQITFNTASQEKWGGMMFVPQSFGFHTTQQMVISSPCLMDNKELTSPKQTTIAMASPKQTAIGKDSSNPFMAGSLPKTTLCFCDKHNMVAFLEKSTGSAGFHQIIDFLNRSHICYALTKKPEVCVSFIKQFWRSAEASTDDNGEVKINATIDGHSLSITEGSLRRHLKLADQDGITSIPNSEIFEQLALMGYHTDSDKLTFQKGQEVALFPSMLDVTTPSTSPSRITSSPSYSPEHSPSPTPSPSPEPTHAHTTADVT
ncbi:hypothetical protein Tco_0804001, partial [Tanacetum coccineum]